MNAKILGLFSGFPTRRIPEEIAAWLDERLDRADRLVFISAWPHEYQRNDDDAAGMHRMLHESGLGFAHHSVIDYRTDPLYAPRLVHQADCIFLMGGDATQQIRLIHDLQLEEVIRLHRGVILGVSAGAGNMARRALDIWESALPYRGLELTPLTIKAHMQPDCEELLHKLHRSSRLSKLPILFMADESAIFLSEEGPHFIGQIRVIMGKESRPLDAALLRQLAEEAPE